MGYFLRFTCAMKQVLLIVLPILLISCQAAKDIKPNIILIYVDDLGLGDVSFSSGKISSTPNIDRMAKDGKIFTQYYSNSPVCSPSRVAVTTGMYPLKWNINTFLCHKYFIYS